jgi:hypothetical protein
MQPLLLAPLKRDETTGGPMFSRKPSLHLSAMGVESVHGHSRRLRHQQPRPIQKEQHTYNH